MEENQITQNNPNLQLTQQPVQSSQTAEKQVSISMQIQQLLVQQQQYQQQYNQLVEYVKQTPNLPIEQVNQIKLQLDQLNSLFVQWKQKLQELGYNQVQVNKPTEVKSWSKNNFSFKKLAIWCVVILLLIFVWFFITLSSLISNPDALLWIWIESSIAKVLLQAFAWLLFWSVIILMLWVVISNIYRLITVKNQSKSRNILGLVWGLLWVIAIWVVMWFVFSQIGKIIVERPQISSYPVQAYLVWKVENRWVDEFNFPYDDEWVSWEKYPLLAPSEVAFKLRWNQILNYQNAVLWTETTLQSVTLLCGNKQWQRLALSGDISEIVNWMIIPFGWTCLYWEKWNYQYSLEIAYRNNLTKENLKTTVPVKSLNFTSEIQISLTSTSSSSSNNRVSRIFPDRWEFILGRAPAKISVDTTQIFRDFSLNSYNVVWDLDWDKQTDRENQVSFDFSYKIPQVYYPSVKFPDLSDFVYTFPVRVEQSDRPICSLNLENFPWTTKYLISTEFLDPSDASKISLYKYTIKNRTTNKVHEILNNQAQEFNYTFPERWNYVVVLDFTTVDDKQSRCESDVIQLEKETVDVQYSILKENSDSTWFSELCSSNWSTWCGTISVETIPQKLQLNIDSIVPSSNAMKKVVSFDNKTLLNEDDTYTFNVLGEWEYILKISISDPSKWIDEVKEIKVLAKKPDIVWSMTITSSDTRQPISEWFEPLTVILDASKTEINISNDEIVFFTWDFWDGEIKKNQSNGVVSHTYHYDYVNENGTFQPKVTITTRNWKTSDIIWQKLNVKKWLISVELSSISHPTRQAQVWREVTFQAEFDWLPEKMTRDFWDGTPTTTCQWRTCTEIMHTFTQAGLYSIKLTLDFDAIQQIDSAIDFKAY